MGINVDEGRPSHLRYRVAPVVEHCTARRSQRHKDREYIQRVTIRIRDRQVDDPFQTVVRPIISCKESKQSRKSRHQPTILRQIEWKHIGHYAS